MRSLLLLILSMFTLYANIGKVSASRGDVVIQRETNDLKVHRGMFVKEKDIILTKKLSRVQVILNDKTVIMIGPKSKFSFDTYSNEKNNAQANMKIHHGLFKAITGEIGKIAPQRFKIKTKTSTIGIRGTHFMGNIEEELEKIACLKGELLVEVGGKLYSVLAGNILILYKGKVENKKLSKYEYKNFRTWLFKDEGFKENDDVSKPEIMEEKKKIGPQVNGNESMDTDVLMDTEVNIEKTDNIMDTVSGPRVVGGGISNPDVSLEPFDPDL